jgi:hypothetical protein
MLGRRCMRHRAAPRGADAPGGCRPLLAPLFRRFDRLRSPLEARKRATRCRARPPPRARRPPPWPPAGPPRSATSPTSCWRTSSPPCRAPTSTKRSPCGAGALCRRSAAAGRPPPPRPRPRPSGRAWRSRTWTTPPPTLTVLKPGRLVHHPRRARPLARARRKVGRRPARVGGGARAVAPGVEELTIECVSMQPASLEWWRPLARRLTHLCLLGVDLLVEAGARVALPPALLELHLGVVDRLPPALAGLARLARLEVSDIEASELEAPSLRLLGRLGGLRALRFLTNCDALKRVPAAMGALTALTHLAIGSYTMSAPGALDPLALLSRLEFLKFRADGLCTPSALAGLTSLRELVLLCAAFESREGPIVEPGLYLAGLRVLTFSFFQRNAPPGLRGRAAARRRAAARLDGAHTPLLACHSTLRGAARLLPAPHGRPRRGWWQASRRCGACTLRRRCASWMTARTLPLYACATLKSRARLSMAAGTADSLNRGAFHLLASAAPSIFMPFLCHASWYRRRRRAPPLPPAASRIPKTQAAPGAPGQVGPRSARGSRPRRGGAAAARPGRRGSARARRARRRAPPRRRAPRAPPRCAGG